MATLKTSNPFVHESDICDEVPTKNMRISLINSGMATNVTFQQHSVTREQRAEILGQHSGYRGCTIWFTGLSGAGKTTISFGLEKMLINLGIPCYSLDGDNVRHGLCKNLGFSKEDRTENIRRVAEMSKLFADMGVISLSSFISPFRADRTAARRIHEEEGIKFFEVFISTPLHVCEARDPKNLYKKARAGQLQGFTGIDSSYEEPIHPDLTINAGEESELESVQRVLQFLHYQGILPEKAMSQLCGLTAKELFITNEGEKAVALQLAENSPKVELSLVDLQWLQVLSEAWASPLSGFMRERQYLQCLHHGQLFDLKKTFSFCDDNSDAKLKNGNLTPEFEAINQSIPIVLPITNLQRESLLIDGDPDKLAKHVTLTYNGKPVALLEDPEVYEHRKQERVHRQFGFSDERHPTIKMIMESGDWLIGGELKVFDRIKYNDGLDEYRKTPLELRKIFDDAGCDSIFTFQLRNPVHNGHALLMNETRAKLLQRHKNPMLLLHPLGGWTKDDDVPLAVRIRQHEAVIRSGVLDPSWTVLAIFPSPMLYAGPTEVQWHARARLSCGINAYIVGRDPAGIQNPETGDYLYDPTHGGKVLSMAPGLSELEVLPFRVAAYDKTAKKMAFFDPARKDDFMFISGTTMRRFARNNEQPPDGFMVPEAWEVLASHYASIKGGEQQQ